MQTEGREAFRAMNRYVFIPAAISLFACSVPPARADSERRKVWRIMSPREIVERLTGQRRQVPNLARELMSTLEEPATRYQKRVERKNVPSTQTHAFGYQRDPGDGADSVEPTSTSMSSPSAGRTTTRTTTRWDGRATGTTYYLHSPPSEDRTAVRTVPVPTHVNDLRIERLRPSSSASAVGSMVAPESTDSMTADDARNATDGAQSSKSRLVDSKADRRTNLHVAKERVAKRNGSTGAKKETGIPIDPDGPTVSHTEELSDAAHG